MTPRITPAWSFPVRLRLYLELEMLSLENPTWTFR